MKHTRVALEEGENRVPRRAENEQDFDAGRPEGGSGPPTFLVLDMRWTGSCCRHYRPGIGQKVDRVMLPSLSVWYWTYGGQGHTAVSISLVLGMKWTGSCCSLYQPGIGQKVDRVMLQSLSAWYWT